MTIILTVIAIIAFITLVPTMAIFMAYEICPMEKMPAWLNNTYNFITKKL